MSRCTAWTVYLFILVCLIFVMLPSSSLWAGDAQAVDVPMRDGKSLAGDLLLPGGDGPFPTILIFTPYNKKRMTTALPESKHGSLLFDTEHFAYLLVDWRGYFASKKAKVRRSHKKLMTQNGEDGYDLVEWIAKQPWSDGKVGMWGPSALGRVQFATAAEEPPHLVCIAPVVAGSGQRYDHYFSGGVMRQGLLQTMNKIGYAGVMRKIKKIPEYNRIWKFIERGNHDLETIKIPTLMIGGWFDTDTAAVLQTYETLRKNGLHSLKLLIGPWTHRNASNGKSQNGELQFPDATGVSKKLAARFFDFYLRNKTSNGYDNEPSLRYFQTHQNIWHSSDTWPPKTVETSTLYLHNNATLKSSSIPKDQTALHYTFDPADPSPTTGGFNLEASWQKEFVKAGPLDQRKDVESRDDLLLFTGDTLEADVHMQGQAVLKLLFSSDRVDTDISFRLCDVFPDGRSMLVTDGIQRLRYRTSLEKAALMTAGIKYPVTIKTVTTAWTFKKGHKIRVLVASSNAPAFAINPNNGNAFMDGETEPLVAENTLHFLLKNPPLLQLPVNKQLK